MRAFFIGGSMDGRVIAIHDGHGCCYYRPESNEEYLLRDTFWLGNNKIGVYVISPMKANTITVSGTLSGTFTPRNSEIPLPPSPAIHFCKYCKHYIWDRTCYCCKPDYVNGGLKCSDSLCAEKNRDGLCKEWEAKG